MATDSDIRNEKVQLCLDDEELKAIDDWRFKHRMPSRAAALRNLLRQGIFHSNDKKDCSSNGTTSSSEFRVVTKVEREPDGESLDDVKS